MESITFKTKKELLIIQDGGKKLKEIKEILFLMIKEGISAADLDIRAQYLIRKAGGYPSFKTVPGYNWSICVNVNEGVVHGVPKRNVVFKDGDIVSVDIGFLYKGFHTDTSFSCVVGNGDESTRFFLEAGRKALKRAVDECYPGNRIYDISKAIESELEISGLRPTTHLTGHGIGRNLHEEPMIPCFVGSRQRDDTPEIKAGMALALEVIYLSGEDKLLTGEDGWTISTADGKIAGLFEDTLIVTPKGPLVVT